MSLDYAVPPGAYLEEWMEHYQVPAHQIAQRTGRTTEQIEQLIVGLVPVDRSLADALHRVTGINGEVFMTYDEFYVQQLDKLGLQRGQTSRPASNPAPDMD